jgi:hypothetical protein
VKKLVLWCAAAVLAAATTAAVATDARTSGKTMTIQLVEKQTAFKYIDNPPKSGRNQPPSMGDQFAFKSDLQTKGGKHLGTLNVTCTVTTGGKSPVSTCTGIMSLAGGQIAAVALVPLSNAQQPDIPVVGGTGKYLGATGTLHTHSRGQNSPYSDDTLHLVLPS